MHPYHLGDHLVTQRFGYEHHGLYIGHGDVIHYANHQPESLPAQIEVCSLSTFSQGYPIRVAPHPHRCITPEESVNRAMSRLGEQEYSLLFNNCEHFVMWCIEDEHTSPQITELADLSAQASALYWVAQEVARENPRSELPHSLLNTSTQLTQLATRQWVPSPLTTASVVVDTLCRVYRWLRH